MTTYAQDVAEHEFMERMIPTILAQLRQQQWQEPYAHPDYINHCEKMRKIRVRIVEAESGANQKSGSYFVCSPGMECSPDAAKEIADIALREKHKPYDCAAQESKKAYY